jgi:general secretion pathway protein I
MKAQVEDFGDGIEPNSHPRHPCRVCGFTLIEILVALAVLAIALAAAVRALGVSIDGAAALRDRTLAQWVAEDRLATHEINHDWPALDTAEGDAEMGGRKFHWREQVAATPVARLRRIEVSVYLPGADTPLAQLATFVGQLSGGQPTVGQPSTAQ